MKRFAAAAGGERKPLAIAGAKLAVRDRDMRGGFVMPDGTSEVAGCVRCPTTPCRTVDLNAPTERQSLLCPVDAIHIDEAGEASIDNNCVGCGLCVIACPVGAIELNHEGAVVHPLGATPPVAEASIEEFEQWLTTAGVRISTPKHSAERFRSYVLERARGYRQRPFYPVVQGIFRALGIPASESNHGDTSNRADLILTDLAKPIPAEVKSFTEVPTINGKSIEQALENKLSIARIHGFEALDDVSSLSIGYAYPADRTGIAEQIDAIEAAFGIRIGLISLDRLYDLLIEQDQTGKPSLYRVEIEELKGPL